LSDVATKIAANWSTIAKGYRNRSPAITEMAARNAAQVELSLSSGW